MFNEFILAVHLEVMRIQAMEVFHNWEIIMKYDNNLGIKMHYYCSPLLAEISKFDYLPEAYQKEEEKKFNYNSYFKMLHPERFNS